MQNWYKKTKTGQRVFMFVIALLLTVGVVGTAEAIGALALLWLLPLVVLIYLQLGASGKTAKQD